MMSFSFLEPWVQSINDSGFELYKVLIAINTTQEMCQEIIDAGLKLLL
jgi:hypothetical protein